MGDLCRNQIFAVMKPAVLHAARNNGAIVHEAHQAPSQGILARAWFAVGTVGLLIAYGAICLCYFLTGNQWRRDLDEANGK
jgi:hypothetical protein